MIVRTAFYVKNSVEAAALYQEAFGLTLGYHVLNPDGTYYHSELYWNDQELFSVIEAGEGQSAAHAVQINMILDDEAAVRKAFALLSAGGVVETPVGPLPWSPCAATVVDRFGIWWYLTVPQHQPGDDFDPTAPWTPAE